MIVSRLILKNWKNFACLDLKLGPRVFLVGANASGKSNLMDALVFLQNVAGLRGGLQEAVQDRGGLGQIRSFFAEKDAPVEILISLSDCPDSPDTTGPPDLSNTPAVNRPVWTYAIGMEESSREEPRKGESSKGESGKVETAKAPHLIYEKVWHKEELICSRPDEQDRRYPERLEQTYLENKTSHQQFRDVARFLQSVQYHSFIPQLLQSPQAFAAASAAPPAGRADPFGRELLWRIESTPAAVRSDRLKRIEAALRATVSQLQDIALIRDEVRQAPHLEAHFENWRAGATGQREEQFSEGTLRLIALLWAMLDDTASLLLLEEPEVSLPAAVVRRLAAEIHICQSEKEPLQQVMVSTHSFDLLSDPGIGGEEVVVLQPGKIGSEARLACAIPEVRELLQAGFAAGEAVLPRAERLIAPWNL